MVKKKCSEAWISALKLRMVSMTWEYCHKSLASEHSLENIPKLESEVQGWGSITTLLGLGPLSGIFPEAQFRDLKLGMDHNTPRPLDNCMESISEAQVKGLRLGMNHNTPRPWTPVQNIFRSLVQRSEARDGSQHSQASGPFPYYFLKPGSVVWRPVMNYNTSGSWTTVWNIFRSLGQRSKARDGSQHSQASDPFPNYFLKPGSVVRGLQMNYNTSGSQTTVWNIF
jgi:hypothetical protein